MYIKDLLLLIRKSIPRSGGSGFPLSLSSVLNHIIININVLRASLNKTFPSFLPFTNCLKCDINHNQCVSTFGFINS